MTRRTQALRRRSAVHPLAVLCAALALTAVGAPSRACPADASPRAAGVLLTVQGEGLKPQAWSAGELSGLRGTTLTHEQQVVAQPAVGPASASAAGAGGTRRTVYRGILLRDVLQQAGFGLPQDRGARTAVIEAVATDGYRALFSWGELFNGSAGEQTLVILAQDGRTLDAAAGPLALRALGDQRPGPRHVRNLCGIVVRRGS